MKIIVNKIEEAMNNFVVNYLFLELNKGFCELKYNDIIKSYIQIKIREQIMEEIMELRIPVGSQYTFPLIIDNEEWF